MPMPKMKSLLLSPVVLLLAMLACAPAWGAPVQGVEVAVRNHEGRFVGGNLIDGDTATAWVGGGTGVGPGKWIEFTFPVPVRLESLKVANGHQGPGRFDKFRRLTRGVILYPDGTRRKFSLKPESGVQAVRLEPKIVNTFRIIITGVDPAAGDETMGKAKVAVSEMTVYGEVADGLAAETAAGEPEPVAGESELAAEPDRMEKAELAVKEKSADGAVSARAMGPSEKRPEPVSSRQSVAEKKPAPTVEAPSESKAEAKPAQKVVAKKAELRPAEAKKAAPKTASEPRKPVAPKAAPKKKTVAAKAKKAAAPKPKKAASGTISYLRPATEIPADKPLDMGVINPWLDLELVAGIKRFLSHLTTLSDAYPEGLSSAIRERERAAFLALQDASRKSKEFNHHHIAMLELIGLNFDKPEESGDAVAIHVHGPCRYYVGDRGYEFPVDAVFTLVRENGAWLVRDVRDK